MKNSERITQLNDRIDSLEVEVYFHRQKGKDDLARDLEPIWDRLNKLEEEAESEDTGKPSEYVIAAGRFAIQTLKELRGYVDGELHELTTTAIDKLEDALDKW